MKIKSIIFALGIMMILFACGSEEKSGVEVGFKNISLNDNHKEVSRGIPSLQKAPEHVSAKRGEGFKEYFSTSSPVFSIAGTNFNPSIFCVFNPADELVSFKMLLLCEVSKGAFNQEKMIGLLSTKIAGLKELSQKENMKEQIGNDIHKKISVDMESMEDYPVLEYEVKYLP